MSSRLPRLPNFVLGSLLAHAALAGVGLFVASRQTPLSLDVRPRQTVEMEFTSPERAPEPQQPPQAAQPEPPVQQPTQQPQTNARVIREPNPSTNSNSTAEPNPNANPNATGTPTVEPNPNPNANPNPNPAPNTGTGLTAPGAGLRILSDTGDTGTMMTVARNTGLALPTENAAQRAERRNAMLGIVTRRCTGTPEECARAVASAPMAEALASQQRPNPPGTGTYARQVTRRAGETFLPVRMVPNIGSIVSSRGTVVTPSFTRTPSAGENAHNADMAARTGIDMGSGTVTIPQASYRMVRVEVEVDQDASGAITGSRVASSSRSSEFDRAAERAIREALGEADRWQTSSRRRSRWAIEVSEAVDSGRIDTFVRSGGSDPNTGWTVSSERSNGMRIRYRIRMVSMNLLRDDAPSGGTLPGGRGNAG